MHLNGWGSETGGEEATKEWGWMPWAAMLSSAGEPGETVRSPPTLFHPWMEARAWVL